MCDKDLKLIQDIVYRIVQQYSDEKGIDNLIIFNDVISGFSSIEQLYELKDMIDNYFFKGQFGSVVKFNKDNLTIQVGNTEKLIKMLKDNDMSDETVSKSSISIGNLANEISPKYHVPDQEKLQFVKKYSKSLTHLKEKVIKDLNTVISLKKHVDNVEYRKQLLKKEENLQKILFSINSIKKEIGFDLEKLIETAEETVAMFHDLVKNIEEGKSDPDSIEFVIELSKSIELFLDEFGNKRNAPESLFGTSILNSENNSRISNINNMYFNIRKRFNNAIKENDIKFLQSSPILLSKTNKNIKYDDKLYSIRDIVLNVNHPLFKHFFGGEKIQDINTLEKLGLNVDTSSTFDGVLGQLQFQTMRSLTQRWNNIAYERKIKLINISKKLRDIGINLDDPSTCDFFYEKDEHGNYTGNLNQLFSYKFRNKINEFMSLRRRDKKNQMKKIEMIHNDFEIVNIFKLSFFHKDSSELDKNSLEYQLMSMLESFYPDLDNIKISNMEDPAYEKELKMRLGESTYNEVIENAMNVMISYINARKDTDMRDEIDPLKVLTVALQNENNYNSFRIMGTIPETAYAIERDEKKYYYDFNLLPLIPKKDREDYVNKSFVDNFINESRHKDIKTEAYEIISETLYNANSLYRGKSDLYLTKVKVDWKEDANQLLANMLPWHESHGDSKQLFLNVLYGMKDELYTENFYTDDTTSVSSNYKDTSEKEIKERIHAYKFMSKEEVIELGRTENINANEYSSYDEFVEALARKKVLSKFSMSLFTQLMKMHDLYAAQNAREEMYPQAKSIFRQYKTYYMNNGMDETSARAKANERMQRWISSVVQKINFNGENKIEDFKITEIDVINNCCNKMSRLPIIGKLINHKTMKKLTENEKEMFKILETLREKLSRNNDYEFVYEGQKYVCEKGKAYKEDNDGNMVEIIRNEEDSDEFDDALKAYFSKKIDNLGSAKTLSNIVNVLNKLIYIKGLGGISTSGLFNRMEGMFANQYLDASGKYWVPGDMAIAENEFFFSGLTRYINSNGDEYITGKGMPMFERRFKNMKILKLLSERMSIFQDMKNQLDRTIEGTQKGTIMHNLDIFQLSVEIPEFKNQMSVALAMMMDDDKISIKDINGNSHALFDRETGEFTCYDLKDNQLVLKREFDTQENRDVWLNFSTMSVTNIFDNGNQVFNLDGTPKTEMVSSQSYLLNSRINNAIRKIQGDYDKQSKLLYSDHMLLGEAMIFKRWYPAKVMLDWSAAGDKGVYNIAQDDYESNGTMYDMVVHTKALWALGPLMSGANMNAGVFTNISSVLLFVPLFIKALKTRFGGTPRQLESNISGIMELAEFMKATMFETLMWGDRVILKNKITRKLKDGNDVSQWSFNDEKWLKEYSKGCVSNMRIMARRMANLIMITNIGFIIKCALWDPDDGDEDEKRMIFNWVDNNLAKLSQSTVDTIAMIGSFEDKFDVGNIALLRWLTDIEQTFAAYFSGNIKEGRKHLKKSLPLPRMQLLLKKFQNESSYNKDSAMNKFIKYLKDDGSKYYSERNALIRADFVEQYSKMWKDKELPNDVYDELSKKITDAHKEKYGNDVKLYDLSNDEFKSVVRNSKLMPKHNQKEYKNLSNKEFNEILENRWETDTYISHNVYRRFVQFGYNPVKTLYMQELLGKEVKDERDE